MNVNAYIWEAKEIACKFLSNWLISLLLIEQRKANKKELIYLLQMDLLFLVFFDPSLLNHSVCNLNLLTFIWDHPHSLHQNTRMGKRFSPSKWEILGAKTQKYGANPTLRNCIGLCHDMMHALFSRHFRLYICHWR